MKLTPVDDMAVEICSTLESALGRLREVLPDAEIHHVGATALPGAITKGDVDLVVRVDRQDFSAVIALLCTRYSRKQEDNWTSTFGSFGDDDGYALPLGIQVVVRDAEEDVFLYQRDYLLAHRDVLDKYNQIKSEHASDAADGYWRAKNSFFCELMNGLQSE
jgi:GrpB-like predicted nucleotidyltransferase (UPF0157 family)